MTAKYASFDPGGTVGWCLWNEHGQILDKGQCNKDELIDLLETDPFKDVEVVITEDFKLFSWKAKQQAGKRMPASETIGVIDSYVRRGRRKHIKQPSNILTVASRLTNVKMPSTHSKSHWVSAFLHGAYYLIGQGLYETPLAKETGEAQKRIR